MGNELLNYLYMYPNSLGQHSLSDKNKQNIIFKFENLQLPVSTHLAMTTNLWLMLYRAVNN